MAKVLDFVVSLSMALGAEYKTELSSAVGALSKLQEKCKSLQTASKNIAGFQKQTQSLETLRQRLTAARERIKTVQSQMKSGAISGTSGQSMLTQAYKEAARLQEQVQQNIKRLGEFRAQLQGAGIDTNNLAGAGARLQSQTDAMTRAQERLSNAQRRYAQIQGQLGNMKADLMQSAAAVMALKQPVKVNMEFEQAMADVAAVARPTAEEFKALTEQAKYLGRTTQYTASDAAKAQQNLIRSGMTAEQVIKALPAALNMASAEGITIDQSSSIIAKALGGMNLSAEMAPRLVDILSYTSAHSNTDTLALSEAFKVAAPVAASQNIKPEQLAAYLGIMANKGFEGSEAGNALGSSIQRLAKMPAQAKQALTQLGVAVRTRDGKMVELPEIMRDLNVKLSRFGENEQLGYLARIFGGQYGKQMMAFMQATASGDTERLQAGVYNESFGWSAQSTSLRTNTLSGDMEALSSAWEGLMNRIGETLSPIVRTGTQWLTTAINGITDLIDKCGVLGDAVITIGAGFAAWQVIYTVWKYGKLLVQLPFAKLSVYMAESAANALLTGEKMGLIPSLVGKIGAAFGWLKGVILAHPLLAIAGLVAVVTWQVIEHWEQVKAWFEKWIPPNVWEDLTVWCEETIASIKGLWTDFKTWITDLFAKFNPFNWELPSWLGGGTVGTNTQQAKNAQAALGGWTPPEIPAHATGGILTTPHIGLVAEAGPEAVIPLTDKQRGIPLLMRAAEMLGIAQNSESYSVRNANTYLTPRPSPLTPNPSSLTPNPSSLTPINITVNVQGGNEDMDLAGRIAQAVRDALNDIMSLEERVSYA